MKKLIKGLHQFQTTVFPIKKDFFHALVSGQKPEVLFITCSDSRINPHLITMAEPGDLFIVRNAGNIIPPTGLGSSEEASIEFAVSELGIKDIIVCGHFHCGAVQAATMLDKLKQLPQFYNWIHKHIMPTVDLVKKNYHDLDPSELQTILIQENVLAQIENLKLYPSIANKKLAIHAWVYKFETGEIFSYNAHEGQFGLITGK